MAKGSSKKPGDPKCRSCRGLLEGRPTVRIGGYKWHQECAEKKGKHVPREYREPRVKKTEAPAEAAETVEMAVVEEVAVEVAEETVA
ncbi:MAG: hypothetical protein EB084_00985 [Proteobacteria bacterium]|nr:hypothetical protein [Pseudomonadota bacterium]